MGYAISSDKSRFIRRTTWDSAREFLDILRAEGWRMNAALDQFEGPAL